MNPIKIYYKFLSKGHVSLGYYLHGKKRNLTETFLPSKFPLMKERLKEAIINALPRAEEREIQFRSVYTVDIDKHSIFLKQLDSFADEHNYKLLR